MAYDRLWHRLLAFLNSWSTAVEIEPGRIEVTLDRPDGLSAVVEVLMSSDEWDEMVSIPWGDFDLAAQEVRKAILGLQHGQRFLVYGQYELVASTSGSLPVNPDDTRLAELRRMYPRGAGRWVAERDGVQDEHRPPHN